MEDFILSAICKAEKLLINCKDKESAIDFYHLVLSQIEELNPDIIISALSRPFIRIVIINGTELRFVHKDSDMCGISFDKEITYDG